MLYLLENNSPVCRPTSTKYHRLLEAESDQLRPHHVATTSRGKLYNKPWSCHPRVSRQRLHTAAHAQYCMPMCKYSCTGLAASPSFRFIRSLYYCTVYYATNHKPFCAYLKERSPVSLAIGILGLHLSALVGEGLEMQPCWENYITGGMLGSSKPPAIHSPSLLVCACGSR